MYDARSHRLMLKLPPAAVPARGAVMSRPVAA
jgi:hypothetical protein